MASIQRRRVTTGLAVLGLVAGGTGLFSVAAGSVAAAPPAATAAVSIANFLYVPDPVTINVGDTIVWTNQDAAPHTATADDGTFDTGILLQGQSGSATFTQAGTIPYFCTVHPQMRGTVIVQAAAQATATPMPVTATPAPPVVVSSPLPLAPTATPIVLPVEPDGGIGDGAGPPGPPTGPTPSIAVVGGPTPGPGEAVITGGQKGAPAPVQAPGKAGVAPAQAPGKAGVAPAQAPGKAGVAPAQAPGKAGAAPAQAPAQAPAKSAAAPAQAPAKAAAAPAQAPARQVTALPRTGDALGLTAGVLALLGGATGATGIWLRRRSR